MGPADVQVDTFNTAVVWFLLCFSEAKLSGVGRWDMVKLFQVGVVTPYVAQVRLKPMGGVDVFVQPKNNPQATDLVSILVSVGLSNSRQLRFASYIYRI